MFLLKAILPGAENFAGHLLAACLDLEKKKNCYV